MKLLTDEQDLQLTLPEIFEIGTTSTFYGLILPGTLSGGLIRWYKLARQGNAVGALASLTWDRLADTVAVAIIGILGVAAEPSDRGAHGDRTWDARGVRGARRAVPRGVLGDGGRRGAQADRRHRPAAARGVAAWQARGGRRGRAKLSRSRRRVSRPKVALLSLAVQLVGSVGFFVWAQALGSPVGLAEVTWARACYTLVLLLPITFAGLGAREGVLILLLQPYGVTRRRRGGAVLHPARRNAHPRAAGRLFELRSFWRRRADENGTTPAPVDASLVSPLGGKARIAEADGEAGWKSTAARR